MRLNLPALSSSQRGEPMGGDIWPSAPTTVIIQFAPSTMASFMSTSVGACMGEGSAVAGDMAPNTIITKTAATSNLISWVLIGTPWMGLEPPRR